MPTKCPKYLGQQAYWFAILLLFRSLTPNLCSQNIQSVLLLKMLDLVSEEEHNEKPLLIHGFSVGGYMYGQTIREILQNPEKYGELVLKIFVM